MDRSANIKEFEELVPTDNVEIVILQNGRQHFTRKFVTFEKHSAQNEQPTRGLFKMPFVFKNTIKESNMMKNVIVISTSLRQGSNSEMLADQFVAGAQAAGHQVEKISLAGKNIQFCKGCMGCQKLGHCVIDDDVNEIMAKVLKADVVCWATPIYYYEMSGQMKTLIDRMNGTYPQDYHFRNVYMLTTAAENEEQTPKRAEIGLTGWIDSYPKSRLAGTLFCGGVDKAREIEGNAKLQEAFNLGKSVQ